MSLFVTGTDTDVGKTMVSSWLCYHLGFRYFKPIQTGSQESCDRRTVEAWSGQRAYAENYLFDYPASPHLAAEKEGKKIVFENIKLPPGPLVVEGAGGVCVPLNDSQSMLDLMAYFQLPILLVASSRLGTINHTLLSLRALRTLSCPVLGVVMVGDDRLNNKEAIEHYGQTVVWTMPWWNMPSIDVLRAYPMPSSLKELCS